MFTPWLASIGAVFPIALVGRRRPLRAHRPAAPAPNRAERLAGRTPHPSAAALAQRVDPPYLCVVPFIPAHAPDAERRAHPRIRNPFRAFPRRSNDLVGLIGGPAEADAR